MCRERDWNPKAVLTRLQSVCTLVIECQLRSRARHSTGGRDWGRPRALGNESHFGRERFPHRGALQPVATAAVDATAMKAKQRIKPASAGLRCLASRRLNLDRWGKGTMDRQQSELEWASLQACQVGLDMRLADGEKMG